MLLQRGRELVGAGEGRGIGDDRLHGGLAHTSEHPTRAQRRSAAVRHAESMRTRGHQQLMATTSHDWCVRRGRPRAVAGCGAGTMRPMPAPTDQLVLGDDLRAFVDASPSPAHAVAELARRLEPPGSPSSPRPTRGTPSPGAGHYVVRHGSLIAFRLGQPAAVGHRTADRRRPHRLPHLQGAPALRRPAGRIPAGRRRAVRRRPLAHLARPRADRRRTGGAPRRRRPRWSGSPAPRCGCRRWPSTWTGASRRG